MKRFTRFKPYIQTLNNEGITLIELIVGGVVSLVVLSVTLGLIVEQRRLFIGDQQRVNFNQNLRTASEFIGTDVKQVGERVESGSPLPVVRLISGATSDAPDALILQRKLIDDSLGICADIDRNDTEITVSDTNDTDCTFSDGNTDNLDDSVGEYKRYRCDLENNLNCARGDSDDTPDAITDADNCDDECVFAFIYDPNNNRGEFFLYTDEVFETNSGETQNKLNVIPLGSGDRFDFEYAASDNPIIYIVEEKKYALCDGVLQLTINRQPDYNSDCPFPDSEPKPVRLVDSLQDFQVRVQRRDGSNTVTLNTLNENLANITSFNEIESIEVELETVADDRIPTASNTLTLSTEFYPRNARSNF